MFTAQEVIFDSPCAFSSRGLHLLREECNNCSGGVGQQGSPIHPHKWGGGGYVSLFLILSLHTHAPLLKLPPVDMTLFSRPSQSVSMYDTVSIGICDAHNTKLSIKPPEAAPTHTHTHRQREERIRKSPYKETLSHILGFLPASHVCLFVRLSVCLAALLVCV